MDTSVGIFLVGVLVGVLSTIDIKETLKKKPVADDVKARLNRVIDSLSRDL